LRLVELRGAWSDGELRGLSGLSSLRRGAGAAVEVALVVAEVREELDPEWVAAARRAGVALGQAQPAWLVERHRIATTWPQTHVIDAEGVTLFSGHPAAAEWVVERWRAGEWGGAADAERLNAALEVLAGLTPELSPRVRLARLSELQQTQPDLRMLTYHAEFTALLDLGHTREAWSLGRTWLARATERGDAVALERLVSEVLANRPKVWMPDLELGLRAARSACEWTGQRDAHLLAQLARVHYLRGEFDSACEAMERALERAQCGGDLGAEELATWRACQARYDRAAGG
jgi:tetratricopeptide (TPR) repeat protein